MAKRKSNYVKLKCSECGTINYYVNKSRGKAGVNYKLEKKYHRNQNSNNWKNERLIFV